METEPTASTQACDRCNKPMSLTPRYPRRICDNCITLLSDAAGRPVGFFNESAFGGLVGFYTDSEPPERYPQLIAYIGHSKFQAQEGRFGGVVIESFGG